MTTRIGPNAAAHRDLLREVSRAACRQPPGQLRKILPNFTPADCTFLRAERSDYFGWDRLHMAACVLGVDIAAIWAKHQPREVAA